MKQMKKYKEQCTTHNKNILYFADNNPMCFQCDYENYWVMESFQIDQESKYIKSQQQKSQIIQLLSQFKRKLSALIKTFDSIKNQQTNNLDNYMDMYLNQDYQIDMIIENIQKMDSLQNMLDKLFQYENELSPKIINIFYPKANKLRALNQEKKEQVQEKIQMQKQNQGQQEQDENIQQDYLDAYENEMLQRVKDLPTKNIYCDEEIFYKKANVSLYGHPIFDELISKKLDINMAPKQLLDLDRQHNLYDAITEDKIIIFGYSQNYLLNGRGMILNENYIENGFYIKGLLVWGQIFSMVYNNILIKKYLLIFLNKSTIDQNTSIIYEEIDNTDMIDSIQLYDNQTILWNKQYYARITYDQ